MNKILSILLFAGLSGYCQELPSDKKATKETVRLYKNLQKQLQKGILFGHQDDLAYGVNWKYTDGNSDVKEVTGEYPAVYGWELGHLELDSASNLDGVPFDKMKAYIRAGYERGGAITISWHFTNPLTGGSAWQPAEGTVAAALPGGAKNELYKSWLDKIALFMLSLKGKNGEQIPIIFRPFHELNGNWFWWGRKHCTPDELKQLWHFTVSYLRDTKNVHNLLYAYNTDYFSTVEEYKERYPGDEWVDIVGFDIYQKDGSREKFITQIQSCLTMLESVAAEEKKVPALTEFGYNSLPDSTWWSNGFLKGIGDHKVAYALAWRNAGKKASGNYEYYVPFKGQMSALDFEKLYHSKKILFQKDAAKAKLYE